MKNTFLAIGLVLAAVLAAPSASAAACGAGDRAQVLWKGAWYPATVQKAKGDECYIHYDGYGSSWDEWVGPDRIRLTSSPSPPPAVSAFGAGDPVSVKWKGRWWPAHVLKVLDGGRYRIHYDGYDGSWDENVGPGRIRSR